MAEASDPLTSRDEEPAEDDGLETVELDDVLARRAPPRRRALRTALVGGALLVVVAALLRVTVPLSALPFAAPVATTSTLAHTRVSIGRVSITPAITSITSVTITSNVSFGTLTLNGQRLPGPAPQMVTLSPKANTILLDAPPFQPVKCTMGGLASTADLTALTADGPCNLSWSAGDAGAEVRIQLGVTGDDLPPSLRSSALAVVRRAVSDTPVARTSVPDGQYFATGVDASGAITSQRATQSLTATLSVAPAATYPVAARPLGGSPRVTACPELACEAFEIDQPIASAVWFASESVTAVWRFTTAAGDLAGTVALPILGVFVVPLSYSSSGWQVADAQSGSAGRVGVNNSFDLCESGTMLIGGLSGGSSINSYETRSASGIEGCRVQVQTSTSSATVIWRFGVLLAADASAHALFPTLPMAPTAEINAIAAVLP